MDRQTDVAALRAYYGSLAAADAYAADQGGTTATAWAALSEDERLAKLAQASAYVDSLVILPVDGRPGCVYRFPGTKALGYAQVLQWPRKNALLEGETIPSDAIPAAVEVATYMAAMLLAQMGTGGLLDPATPGGAVTSEQVDVIKVSYAAKAGDAGAADLFSNAIILPEAVALLRGLMLVKCPGYGRTAISAV